MRSLCSMVLILLSMIVGGFATSQTKPSNGKEVSLIVFMEKDCPCNVLCAEDMNRIAVTLKSVGITMKGLTNADKSAVKSYRNSLKLQFPLESDISGSARKKMGVGYSLELRLVSSTGKQLKAYEGYSQAILRRMESDILSASGRKVTFELSLFPDRTRYGCKFN
jgi:hypothetical protein